MTSTLAYFDGSITKNPAGKITAAFCFGAVGESVHVEAHEENTVNVAEALGAKHLLLNLVTLGIDDVIIHGDSKIVINRLRSPNKPIPEENKGLLLYRVLQDCYQLMKQFKQISFKWIPRELNTRADKLSKRKKGVSTDES